MGLGETERAYQSPVLSSLQPSAQIHGPGTSSGPHSPQILQLIPWATVALVTQD